MQSSPENGLTRQLSSRLAFLTTLLAFALTLLLTACSGANAGTASQSATTVPMASAPLSLAPGTIDFGTVLLNSKKVTRVISLTNVGTSTETIKTATIVPTPLFSLQGWTGPVTVGPGQTVQLRTSFAPQSVGNYSGTLTLVTEGAAQVASVRSPVINGPGLPRVSPGQVKIPMFGAANAGNSPPPIVGVSVSPTSLALQSGQAKQFTSAVTGTSNTAVTWVAALGSISTSGLYTAPPVTSQTLDTVSAISVADSTKYANAAITINPTGGTGTGPYSILNQEDITNVPSAGSLFGKRLPADVMSHLAVNGEIEAQDSMVACYGSGCTPFSQLVIAAQDSTQDNNGVPFYYSQASDPYYMCGNQSGYNSCGNTPTVSGYSPTNIPFHAPSAAQPSSGDSDQFTQIWDQDSNKMIYLYWGTSGNRPAHTFPSCPNGSHAGTLGDPCSFPAADYGTMDDRNETQAYGILSGDSLNVAAGLGHVRVQEFIQGHINHPIYLNTMCQQPSDGDGGSSTVPAIVFPNTIYGAQSCGGQTGAHLDHAPPGGALIFLDYTDAQLALLKPYVPAWQYVFLEGMSHFGGYVGDTGNPLHPSRVEDATAYNAAGISDPLLGWLKGQPNDVGSTCGSQGCNLNWQNMKWSGSCPTANGGADNLCSLSAHIHIADQCVAKGLAGMTAAEGACF